MGSAYFIVLDNPDPSFDSMVNGKAIAREAKRLEKVASSLGLKRAEDYLSMSGEEAAAMARELGVEEDISLPTERWFDADEGLVWVRRVREHVQSNPHAVRGAGGVLSDLAEYERVLSQAKAVGAKWHLSVDF